MATNIKDFFRGDTVKYKFEFGNGIDITGWIIYFTLKLNKEDEDSDAVMQVSNTAGDNILDDIPNGTMYVTATSIETSATEIEPNTKYFYGFQRVIAGSPPDVKTLHVGTVKILQGITTTIT